MHQSAKPQSLESIGGFAALKSATSWQRLWYFSQSSAGQPEGAAVGNLIGTWMVGAPPGDGSCARARTIIKSAIPSKDAAANIHRRIWPSSRVSRIALLSRRTKHARSETRRPKRNWRYLGPPRLLCKSLSLLNSNGILATTI
ncbi:MAG TPA: hypothetical protein VKS22_01795 [Candidatus Binataceae bacterium]|nr:hypothetical protein [Candidatus Binataceae bacterium]